MGKKDKKINAVEVQRPKPQRSSPCYSQEKIDKMAAAGSVTSVSSETALGTENSRVIAPKLPDGPCTASKPKTK